MSPWDRTCLSPCLTRSASAVGPPGLLLTLRAFLRAVGAVQLEVGHAVGLPNRGSSPSRRRLYQGGAPLRDQLRPLRPGCIYIHRLHPFRIFARHYSELFPECRQRRLPAASTLGHASTSISLAQPSAVTDKCGRCPCLRQAANAVDIATVKGYCFHRLYARLRKDLSLKSLEGLLWRNSNTLHQGSKEALCLHRPRAKSSRVLMFARVYVSRLLSSVPRSENSEGSLL